MQTLHGKDNTKEAECLIFVVVLQNKVERKKKELKEIATKSVYEVLIQIMKDKLLFEI